MLRAWVAVLAGWVASSPPQQEWMVTGKAIDDRPDLTRIRVLATGVGAYAFSADSRWVVYADGAGLHSVRGDGSGRRRLLPGQPAYFLLTPNARHVLIPGEIIARVPIRGGERFEIAANAPLSQFGSVIVSPDSQWVGFTAASGDVYVASIGNGTLQKLPIPPVEGSNPYHHGVAYLKSFTGDSSRLFYQRGGGYEVIGRDGQGRVRLSEAMGGEAVAGESALHFDSAAYYAYPLDGSPPRSITTPKLLPGFPQPKVAPDARSFAFLASGGGLHHVDLQTLAVRSVSPPGLEVLPFVEFSPDSRALVFAGRLPDGGCEFRHHDLAADRGSLLATIRGTDQCFAKPAGNRRVVFYEYHPDGSGLQSNLFAVDLGSLRVRRLAPTLMGAGNFSTSPDGQYVLFDSGDRGQARLISIHLGRTRQ